ncbi:putative sugar phosphate/phosphate translocator, partial [Dichanthelium oligosanthes]
RSLLYTCREKMNSMGLLRYIAPVAVILLVPATLIIEREAFGVVATLAQEDPNFIWILLCNSSLTYFVNLTNFLVAKHTSPLTLQILRNAKGAVTVVVSILIFRNQ